MSLKGFVFLKIWSFEFFRFFSDFNLIFTDFISYSKSQKRGVFFYRTRGGQVVHGVDVVHGICADATRHARPRGRAARAHTARRWRTSGA